MNIRHMARSDVYPPDAASLLTELSVG